MTDFFDKVKQGIGKGVTTAAVRSKEVLETTKLNSQIRKLQEHRKGLLEELGNITYTMFRNRTFVEERLKAKSAVIVVLDEQINQKQKELVELHSRAQEALGTPKPAAMCSYGVELYEGAKFCGKCGAKAEATPGRSDP